MVSRCFEAVDVSISLRRNVTVRTRLAKESTKRGGRADGRTDSASAGGGKEGRGREKREINFDTFAQMTTVTSRGKYRKLRVAKIHCPFNFANNVLGTAPR